MEGRSKFKELLAAGAPRHPIGRFRPRRPAGSYGPLFEMLHIYMVWLGFAKTHTYPVWGMTTLRQFRSVGCNNFEFRNNLSGVTEEARRRGAPLAGTANSSPVETPSGGPTTSCGRV